MTAPEQLKTTLVLTSRKNFVWHSMQEIIPSIEETWRAIHHDRLHHVYCFDVDRCNLREYLPIAIRANNVVITCFTPKLSRIGSMLRSDLGIPARYLIYLHNQATVACWPFHAWGLGKVLRTDDIYISSCSADAATMLYSFSCSRIETVPFTLPHLNEPEIAPRTVSPSDPIPLIYVGRISVQKNLHLLLYALHLYLKNTANPRVKLDIYGAEDNLGSPNMGLEFDNYTQYLSDLCNTLGLSNLVTFKGHLDREQLYKKLAGITHIFVSASLHSDENFGMAAFRSLCMGNHAILSKWGGHSDFAEHFHRQLHLVDVHESPIGPFIDPKHFAQQISEAVSNYRGETTPTIPSYFRPETVGARLLKMALENTESGNPAEITPLAKTVLSNRNRFLSDSTKQCKIFASYADPIANSFFRSYGMKRYHRDTYSIDDPIHLVPWAYVNEENVDIRDPHRGHLQVQIPNSVEANTRAVDVTGTWYTMNSELAHRLIELGYAHG